MGKGFVMRNALTIDVEDYYQVAAFESVVSVADWEWYESRVEHNTEKILALLDDASVHATFFVLGWVAERYLQLVRRIAMAQHEVACHGYAHRRIYTMTPQAFRQDIRQAKQLIEDAAAAPVIGYRAPSYSITTQSQWALTILAEEGFKYDSSIFPIRHDLCGIPHHPRFFHLVGSPQSRQRSRGSAIAATGMAIGAQLAPPSPPAIVSIGVRTKMPGGIHLTRASGGWGHRSGPYRRRSGIYGLLLTQHTGGLVRPACTGLGFRGTLGLRRAGRWLGWPRMGRDGLARPGQMAHHKPPYQRHPNEWVVKQR